MILPSDTPNDGLYLKDVTSKMKKMVDTVMVMALLMSSIPGLAEKAPADVFPLVAEDAEHEMALADDEGMNGHLGSDGAGPHLRRDTTNAVEEGRLCG